MKCKDAGMSQLDYFEKAIDLNDEQMKITQTEIIRIKTLLGK